VHNSFNIQQYIYIYYITLLNMFRAARCSSSGEPIDTRGCGDTIGPPDDEQSVPRNMSRSVR